MTRPGTQVPLVDYLVIGDGEPYLTARQCEACGARFFDRRNACARCSSTAFVKVPIARSGEVVAFSLVNIAPPDIEVPFVAAIVDCEGTSVRANLRNVAADDQHVQLGMKVRLMTYSMGTDEHGAEGVAFGFEPSPDWTLNA